MFPAYKIQPKRDLESLKGSFRKEGVAGSENLLRAAETRLRFRHTREGQIKTLRDREERKEGAMEKILCVDDDLSLLHLYRDELIEEGYEVILAKDGKEALAKFSKEKPDVVVTDIRMPLMDGIEALTEMLGKSRQASVILNTAYPQYQENFMTWGADAYVLKSSDLTELKQKIRAVLDRREKGMKS